MKTKILLLIVLCFAGIAFSQVTVIIEPDKDNSIYSEINNSNGTGYLFSGYNCGGHARRALMHFDIAGAIPAGATITAVTLTLNVNANGGSSTSELYNLHPLTTDWGEGTSFGSGSGAPAVFPDATWSDAMLGTPWSTNGGDFGASVATTNLSAALGNFSWSSPGMIANVQNWLNTPASNFGWILIGNETVLCTARRFGSKDLGVAPALAVTYTCATAPTASCQNVNVYLNTLGQFTLNGAAVSDGSVSNCGGPLTYNLSQNTFDCADISGGPVPVTLTVTDQFSNTASCNASVTVFDTLGPNMDCIGPTTFSLDLSGNLTLSASDLDDGTADPCGLMTTMISQTDFDCTDLGLNEITLGAIDIYGNTNTCIAYFVIIQSGGILITEDAVVDVTCNGDNDGSISVSISGGSAPYIIDWDNDGTGDNDDPEDLSGLSGGTFTLTVSDQAGCTAQYAATIIDPAIISATLDTDHISCIGQNDGLINMSVTGGTLPYVFDWDNDGTGDNDDAEDLANLTPGTYTVVIEDNHGCTISVNETILNASPVDVSVTQADVTLTANATGANYQWVTCPDHVPVAGEINAAFYPVADGDYAVIVTNGAGCSDTSICYTVLGVGIEEIKPSNASIYPNPADNILTIVVPGFTDPVQIFIRDSGGRIIAQKMISTQLETIDISELENGTYFIISDDPCKFSPLYFIIAH